MKPFKVASFQTTERRSLGAAARELGHGLQIRSGSELATIRREVSEIGEATTDEYTAGFLHAIEHVLAGLSAEVKHRRAVAEDVASAHLRKNATKVLLALHGGCVLPSEIADRTGLQASAVSNELAELERQRLVERAPRIATDDQRTVPRALSVRGMQLADELARTKVSPAAAAAAELAPVFVGFYNQLADESYLAPQRLEEAAIERLGTVDGHYVWTEFITHATRQCSLAITDSAVALTSALYRRRLRDLLQAAMSSAMPALFEPIRQLSDDGSVCLRATTALRDQWNVALATHQMRRVYPWCRDDARAEQLPAPAGVYHIVWENPEVMTRDLEDSQLRSFIARSKRRLCYVATKLELPETVERIELDASLVGG